MVNNLKVKKFCSENNISPIYTPIYYPKSNGIVERINQHVSELLRVYKGVSLPEILEKIEHKINHNYHSGLKASPIEVAFKVNFYDPYERVATWVKPPETDKNDNVRSSMTIKSGDKVYLEKFNSSKLDQKFERPYEIENWKKKWVKVLGIPEWFHINQ